MSWMETLRYIADKFFPHLHLNIGDLFFSETFSFIRSHLSGVGLNVYTARVLFRKSFPMPVISNVAPASFCVSYNWGPRSYAEVLSMWN